LRLKKWKLLRNCIVLFQTALLLMHVDIRINITIKSIIHFYHWHQFNNLCWLNQDVCSFPFLFLHSQFMLRSQKMPPYEFNRMQTVTGQFLIFFSCDVKTVRASAGVFFKTSADARLVAVRRTAGVCLNRKMESWRTCFVGLSFVLSLKSVQ